MKTKQKRPISVGGMRKKLFSAAAMLLVASIMLVSTSYAWLVLSAAPEITGISTQVGANGALEIALLNTESYNDLTKVVDADIDESLEGAAPAVTSSNLQWGNLIGLGDASYGLDQIVLNPGRLYIEPFGEGYQINQMLMKTPIYNEDGRIVGLEKTKTVTGVFADDKFNAGDGQYGVRAIGLAANMSEAQLGINAARATLSTNMATAKTTASNILNQQGNALGNVAIGVALGNATGFAKEDVESLKLLGEGLQSALDKIDTAVRQVFLGYLYTTELTGDDFTAAKTEIENKTTTLTDLGTKYPTVLALLPSIRYGETQGNILALLEHDKSLVKTAIDDCDAKLAGTQETFSESEIIALMNPLVDYNQMTMGGYTVPELKEMVANDQMDELMSIVMNGGLKVSVPSGSGILSDIADFAGNYTAEVTVKNVSAAGITLETATATMATATVVNPVYLTGCSNAMRNFSASEGDGTGGSVITDYYGYAIDLAFRTNATGNNEDGTSNLLLQTESAQRVYDESNNEATQGGGSYMSFKSDVGLSATKMTKLMSGIRVVFMDQTRQVLAIAALDTQLSKKDYATGATTYTVASSVTVDEAAVTPSAETCSNYVAEITKAEYNALADTTVADEANAGKYVLGKDAYTAKDGASIPEGKYAVLRYDNPQNSDYITEAEYRALPDGLTKEDYSVLANGTEEAYAALLDAAGAPTETTISKSSYEALPETATVTVAADGTVKAKLYLYDFTMPKSTVNTDKETGAIALGNKRTSAAITSLEENVAKQVTAMVYLDGSIVNNSMVAANSSYSMTGTMNLQFASSAELVPMHNQELFDGEDEDAQLPEGSDEEDEKQDETPAAGGADDPTGTDPVTDPATEPENGAEGA